jgi:hypothetical protein
VSRLHEESKRLFVEALSLPPGEREAFLASESEGDEALRAEVRSLLDFHDRLDLNEADEPYERGGLTNHLRASLRSWVREGRFDRPPFEG